MAMIKCPECRKEISSKANSCPNCGYEINTPNYGERLGIGIKRGMKGLNTMASPKKRKTCILMLVIPLFLFILFFSIGIASNNDNIASLGLFFGFCLGIYQFYIGKIKKGLLYTITIGGMCIGALIDLFRLTITKTLCDANGFPIIY